MWRSLVRWVLRRPVEVEPGAEAFSYAGAMTGFIGAMIAVSLIEVPAMHLILPWRWAQLIALPLGVVGVLFMLGIAASLKMNPHVVGESGLRVRFGTTVDAAVPWEPVTTVTHKLRAREGRAIGVQESEGRRILHVSVSNQTNVDVVFTEPTAVPLPKGKTELVDEVRLFADDAGAFVTRARAELGAARERA